MKSKPGPIANAWQVLHARKEVWLCMDDQEGRIYLAPMVAAYATQLSSCVYV